MKKLILAAAIIFTVALSSCTKENVAPASAAPTLTSFKLATGDKGNLSQADFVTDSVARTGDKGNLSQADFTASSATLAGDKGNLSQADLATDKEKTSKTKTSY
jgi:rRNA maturation endonuclease Nob1